MGTVRRLLRWGTLGLGGSLAAVAAVLGIALLIPGCSVGYVTRQSVAHLKVLAARQDVDRAIARGEVPDEWLPKIDTLRDAKRFGAEELGLPTRDLYETISLADVGPTWIVTACPQDSLEPVTWWFPIVGRVAYKGYYNKDGAERLAAKLRAEGNDVLMYPSAAFSTLGWFDDPIRPSMLQGDDEQVANLVLHEAAHAVLYWKGQTSFNESFASFVGDVGAIRYLEARFGPGCGLCRRAIAAREDAPRFGALIERVVERLQDLYGQAIGREEKLRRREEVFAWAREEYDRIPWSGNTYAGFRARPLDNAVVLSYRRYGQGQDVFDALLRRCDGDLRRAIETVWELDWPGLGRAERRSVTPMQLLERRLEDPAPCPPAE